MTTQGLAPRLVTLISIATVATLLALVMPLSAGAQVSLGQDSASGSGVLDNGSACCTTTFSFNATSGPSGENATGTMSTRDTQAVVRCLVVSGNRAIVGGETVAPASRAGMPTYFYVEDNGTPGVGSDRLLAPVGGSEVRCTPSEFFTIARPILVGEIAVSDAPPPPPDSDGDGVPDSEDNCASDGNADQLDADGDGQGDVCDPDRDGDSVENSADNCGDAPNPGQENQDRDDLGDACDPDIDGDGAANGQDNCSTVANQGQENQDGDEFGDACDRDRDGDGVEDAADDCPTTENPSQADADGDTLGDACDPDRDGDGHANGSDNCPDAANPDQADRDNDAQGDACDADRPPAQQITDTTQTVEQLPAPGGTKNSLSKKLQAALEAYNSGDTEGACAKLDSFIHEISAQSGKKISAADAERLLADAARIKTAIGC